MELFAALPGGFG